jgi:hypothetical protein
MKMISKDELVLAANVKDVSEYLHDQRCPICHTKIEKSDYLAVIFKDRPPPLLAFAPDARSDTNKPLEARTILQHQSSMCVKKSPPAKSSGSKSLLVSPRAKLRKQSSRQGHFSPSRSKNRT